MSTRALYRDACTPTDVAEVLGTSNAVVRALIKAERVGIASVHGVMITHSGYTVGTSVFAVDTALYRLTWEA